VNKKIKIDTEYFNNLVGKRNLDNLIKHDDNLYYYKGKNLISLLFNILDYKEIKFKNNDSNDYRFNNLEIILNEPVLIKPPNNLIILETGTSKLVTSGAHYGEERNLYWKMKDNENKEYYVMHVYVDIYTKISLEDIDKILNLNGIRPTWGISNGYIKTNVKIDGHPKVIYLHQYIMDVHFEDNTSFEKTVDHINRDKFDNRRENLRFANMNEQNLNKDKQKRQINACSLPEGIQQKDLPKHVTYNKRCYDKEKDSWREFFQIENHPKLEGVFASSKSNKIPIQDKLNEVKLKLEELNGTINEEEYKILSDEAEYTLPKGFSCKIDNRTNKYILVCDLRNPNINLKMTLTNNNLQLMLDQFIDQINEKYIKKDKDFVKFEKIKLEKPILLDFSKTKNENNEEIKPIENIQKPDLPDHFSLYKENDTWCLGYSKIIDKVRYNKRFLMKCLCIQTELDRLTDELNKEYPNLNIPKYTIKNPCGFTDNKLLAEPSNKPILGNNLTVFTMKDKQYIQFNKKIDGKRYSYKTTIKSNDLQKELDTFIDYLNENYKLGLVKNPIENLNNWLL
jgi:hypothetical protein